MDYNGLFSAAKASGNPKSWLAQKANYQKYGFSSSSGLYSDYEAWNGGQIDESLRQEIRSNISRYRTGSQAAAVKAELQKQLDAGNITEEQAIALAKEYGLDIS